MKKLLLLSLALLGSATAFAGDDITPAGYKFNTAKSINIYPTAVLGANFNNTYPVWTKGIDGDAYYNDGLLVIGGGAYTNTSKTYFADNKQGISLLDLGGTVGQVLCVNGYNSGFNEYFTNLLGREINAPKQGSDDVNWFNYNWFTDPKNTPTTKLTDDKSNPLPTSDGTYIRVRMTLNIFSTIPAEGDGIMKMYMVGNQNNQMPLADASGDYTQVHSSKFAKWDDDEQDYVWSDDEELQYDPTRWQVLEWDTWCKAPDEDGTTYGPIRLKCEITNAAINNKTILIKSIEFIANPVSEVSDPIIKDRRWTAIKLEPGEPAGVNDIVVEDNANAPVEVYNLNGVRVNEDNLAAGLYIRRQGNKVEKVVIK
jgi:hypothetical protein